MSCSRRSSRTPAFSPVSKDFREKSTGRQKLRIAHILSLRAETHIMIKMAAKNLRGSDAELFTAENFSQRVGAEVAA